MYFYTVLLYIRLRGWDGLTARGLGRARNDAKASTPVIVVTADTAPNLRADCLECGANDLVRKPVAMNELYDTLGRVIAAADAADAAV
jgi:DNA-binding response OmpR family regulator